MTFDPSTILIRPRITEKAALVSDTLLAYVFEISRTATKNTVKRAVKTIYKVEPVKVNIVKLRPKKVFSKGKKGSTRGVVKAYVYLKKGDKIEIA